MKLYIVGFGAGGYEYMTIQAKMALENSEIIAGYTTYVDLIKQFMKDKEFYTTSMKQEEARCRWAIEETLKGKVVSLVCSGDSGVYGLASLVYELSVDYDPFEIEVVSGVSAALSGGAVLGAPLNHDFAVISLSDLLTPWEVIERRLECAALGDFVIALYNPSSKKRKDYLMRACDILLEHKENCTVCGIVQNIGRTGESSKVLSLLELREEEVDMFTTVFIGNAATKVIQGKMVTPRGYVLNR
jgi:precorrin-3B C17-methyltransferase